MIASNACFVRHEFNKTFFAPPFYKLRLFFELYLYLWHVFAWTNYFANIGMSFVAVGSPPAVQCPNDAVAIPRKYITFFVSLP